MSKLYNIPLHRGQYRTGEMTMIYCETFEQFANLFSQLCRAREAVKNCYLTGGIPLAHMRRDYEARNTIEKFAWTDPNGDEYTAEQIVTCSCQHIYAEAIYTRNGEKTTFTAVRNSARRMGVEI